MCLSSAAPTSTASPTFETCTWAHTLPAPPPREWGLVPMLAPSTAQFIPPPYALEMCLHLPVGVHYYRVCSGADSWPRDVLSLVGAVHCVQVAGSHQLQLCRKGLPPTSFILPEHHHVILPQPPHSRVSVTATGLTRASVLAIAATYHPRHLRKWVRGLPHALRAAVVRNVESAELAGEGLPRDGEAALFRRAHQLGRWWEVMEGGSHG